MDSLQKRAEEAEEREDFQTALELWKELTIKNREVFFFVRYGSAAKKLGRWDEAEQAFGEALYLDSNSPLIMVNLGDLWARRTDKSAGESFEVAKRWFLKALSYERNACTLTLLGNTYKVLEDIAQARNAFEEAIQIDPSYEEALYNLAVVEAQTNPQRSLELLEKAIQIDPNYAIAHRLLGKLYQKDKDLERAEYHFRRNIEIDPADYWPNLYLANLLGLQGKDAEAEEIYRFATSLHPEIAGGIEIFARFLESIGKREEAESVRARVKKAD